MNASEPLVGVIILNWNGMPDTLECLQSLRQSTHRHLRIIVWDNGSREDPGPALAQFPEVTLLRSDTNIGFAAGCNRGAEQALAEGAQYLLFLNNDTVVPPEMIATMVQAHRQTPQAGLVAVPEKLPNRPDDPRRLGGTWRPLVCRVGWRWAEPDERLPEAMPVDIASGCALLMAREIAERVGLFEPEFFAYWEDVDLSLRVRQAGYANICATGTHILHKSGRSTGDGPGISVAQMYLVLRGQALMVRRHARGLGRLVAPLRLLLSAMSAAASGFFRPGTRKLSLVKLAGLTDGWFRKPADMFWLSKKA